MKSALSFWRALLGATILIYLASLWRMGQLTRGSVSILNSKWTILWAIPFVVILGLFVFSWLGPGRKVFEALSEQKAESKGVIRAIAVLIFAAILPVLSLLVLNPYYPFLGQKITGPLGMAVRIFTSAIHFISIRFLLFWMFSLIGMACLKVAWKKLAWLSALLLSILLNAVVYSLAVDFSAVNAYPLSLSWSEVSRYYGASLFFAKSIYGRSYSLPVLHPTWHLLLTIPYFLGNLPLWVHRFWQAFLQFAITLATGIVFSRRLGLKNKIVFWGIALWAFLFLRQISFMFSLLPSLILILGWADPKKFWRTTLLVFFASIWAGLSRINWFPVPGMFAAVLYFLEAPYRKTESGVRYLWKPATWFLGGVLTALAANYAYNFASGNSIKGGQFMSSLTSTLLWYRLFPNPTFPMGVLLSALLASLPLLAVIVLSLRGYIRQVHPLRLAGIYISLAILFFGGLIVSVKIGGGSDLHNLDAYFALLMLVGGYFYFRRWMPESDASLPAWTSPLPLALTAILPVWFILQTGGFLLTWNQAAFDSAIDTVRTEAQQAAQKGGEVLFISDRQLLALGTVRVPLIPDYEQDYMMEMLMSHNMPYVERFQQDLSQQRFALIIAEPQNVHIYERNRDFSEENNLWVQEVSVPLLCYYEPISTFGNVPLVVYAPRAQPCK